MPYALQQWATLGPIEWSQAAWRVLGSPEAEAMLCPLEWAHDVLLAHLPAGGLIVDAGCGTARWPIYLGRRGQRCVGVDLAPEACRLARAADASVPLVVGDVRRAPLRDGCADVVLSFGVVEHEPAGPEASLCELRRLLRPGGVLVLTVPYDGPWRRLVVNQIQAVVNWRRRRNGMALGFGEYRFRRPELRHALRATGFEPVAEFPNDLDAPFVLGLAVDRANLAVDPFDPDGTKAVAFRPRSWPGRLGAFVLRRWPLLVCGEIGVVARAT
jgi:SAM-dependent methyltransferase